ncbi:hypothetical protein HMPREF0576_1463 [Mobiluncus holmesii ATCC 35242]|uniref:Histidine kinase N-terminal 7TM region domain-containing protein n=1 Tax=Mobiluncus holmesii ATCC 35242 TaxID=887899 RepID=E6M573_9ACTO|nr:hypothetical protein HMPREF0576_1463 [Mobiluncus holmesii ATCC 35242]
MSVALALGLIAVVLIFAPLRTISFQTESTMAVPTSFDQRLTDYYQQNGIKVETHSEWSLLKLLRSGPAYVITSEVMANSAQKSESEGQFTKLYPESIVLVSRSTKVISITDLYQLADSAKTVYLDQGVSRLELMSALALRHDSEGTQVFSAAQAERLLKTIKRQGRLQTGTSPQDLERALHRGWFCLTTDRRAAQSPAGPSAHYAPAPTLTAQIGIWQRSPNGINGTSPLVAQPPGFFSPLDYPSTNPAFRKQIHAETVTHLNNYEEFIWNASLYNDTYGGSWGWENTNEAYELGGFIALLVFLSFWAGWRFWTATFTYVRWAVLVQAGILALWIMARIIKHASLGVFERYTWYYYYVPIYTTCAILFFVMSHSSRGRPPGYCFLRAAIIGVGATLILLVYTNDLHHLVLRFGTGQSGVDYSYGPGYYLYYTAALLVFAAVIYVGSWSLQGHWLRLVAGIGVLFLAVLFYSMAYTVRIPLVRATETVQMFCVIFVLAWEILFFIGAIGQNRGYLRFFEKSQIPIEIVNRDWIPHYRTSQPLNLDQGTRQQLRDGQGPVVVTDTSVQPNRTVYCQTRPVDGGHVLWETDVTAVQDLERTLAALRARETHQTEILRSEYEATLNMEESADAPVLFDRLDDLMNASLGRIQANTARLNVPLDESERSNILRNIKMDLGYAKRAGLLTLQNFENETVSVNALTTFMSQSCTDFSYAGAVAGLHGPTTGAVQPQLALWCLEGLHRTLNQLIGAAEVAVFVNFEVAPDGKTARLNWIVDLTEQDLPLFDPLLAWSRAQVELYVEDATCHLNMIISAGEPTLAPEVAHE